MLYQSPTRLWACMSCGRRFWAHFKSKGSALRDFRVLNPLPIQQSVIHPHSLNIRMIWCCIVSQEDQIPVPHLDFSAFPEWPSDLVAIRSCYRKQP